MSAEFEPTESRLSRIETLWSVVLEAHQSANPEAQAAQEVLLGRYEGAIRRYLQAAVGNADVADELFQQFALKFLQGDLQNAAPQRGRFRAFVKTILYRMVALHFRQRGRRREHPLESGIDEAWLADSREQAPESEWDERFLLSWREEVLRQTWSALDEYQRGGGAPYHSILQLRVDHPELSFAELAAQLESLLGRPTSTGSARVLVHRARERFAELLLDQVAGSLSTPDPAALEEELVDLRLIDYCRDQLARRTAASPDAPAAPPTEI